MTHEERLAATGIELPTGHPPVGSEWPAGLSEAVRAASSSQLWNCAKGTECPAFALDLDGDGQSEELLAAPGPRGLMLLAFERDRAGGWRPLGWLRSTVKVPASSFEDQVEAIRSGDVRLVAPSHQDVEIGPLIYRLGAPD